jgi:2-polyprenyl-3-methyl-5-hydroxy-6-metoxy-1,4-benzoquinol methylase
LTLQRTLQGFLALHQKFLLREKMFNRLNKINERPEVFEHYTAKELWTEDYISGKMLEFHLNEDVDPASRTSEFMNQSYDWMIPKFEIKEGKKIADFGCGPGFYTSKFAETGAEVTGIDFSEKSINHAKSEAEKNGLDIEYIKADYLEQETNKKFDLITLIYCDLCPLSPRQRGLLLTKFKNCLEEDGLVVLDVFSMNFLNSIEEMRQYDYVEKDGFWSEKPHHIFQNRFIYEAEKVMLDKYVIFEEGKTREIYNWLQCFSLEEITAELAENGLEVVEVFSDMTGKPYDENSPEIALVAKKSH